MREDIEKKRQRWDAALNKTQNELWIDPPIPAKLYHYSTMEAICGILKSHELWLSDITRMNDRFDGTYWIKVFRPIIREKSVSNVVKELFSKTDTFGLGSFWNMYIACLSQESDLDEQWENYADRGKGCALELSVEALLRHCDGGKAFGWMPVLYDAREQAEKATRTVNAAIALYREERLNLSASEADEYWTLYASFSFLKCGVRFKSPEWEAEREWRIYKSKTDSSGVRYRGHESIGYFPLPLAAGMVTGAIKGPACTFPDAELAELLRAGGHEPNVHTHSAAKNCTSLIG